MAFNVDGSSGSHDASGCSQQASSSKSYEVGNIVPATVRNGPILFRGYCQQFIHHSLKMILFGETLYSVVFSFEPITVFPFLSYTIFSILRLEINNPSLSAPFIPLNMT
jgi:hypothetical protein